MYKHNFLGKMNLPTENLMVTIRGLVNRELSTQNNTAPKELKKIKVSTHSVISVNVNLKKGVHRLTVQSFTKWVKVGERFRFTWNVQSAFTKHFATHFNMDSRFTQICDGGWATPYGVPPLNTIFPP